MSDPRFEDRRLGSPYDHSDWRRRYNDSGDGSGWILGAVIAAVLVVGLLAFGMNSGPTTATGPTAPPETTGMAPRSAPAPLTPAQPPAPNRQ
jgi:hypothetical protein